MPGLKSISIRVGKEIEEGFEDLGAHEIAEFIFILDNVAHLLMLSAMLDKQTLEILVINIELELPIHFITSNVKTHSRKEDQSSKPCNATVNG